MSSGDLTEAEWRVLNDLLPIEPENRGRGRLPGQNRSIINGILWRLRCGAPWRDVPPKYASWNTIYRRFRRWSEVGGWEPVAVTLAGIMADSGHYSIDSTPPSAPTSRQRAEKRDSSTRSWPLAGRVHQ
ncbi:transposase [Novosphingobium sp. BW1]|uniref:transposase n=1 Tax=Novosphingobium sp. BW1 TaxID=2592621 RepID=UPI00139693FE|nr:transposase [Novosphingobium sp. BW1]